MDDNENSQVNLLDEIKENASLVKELIKKAEENRQDKELVNNCVVAMKSGEGVKEGGEGGFGIFGNFISGIVDAVVDYGKSFIDAFNEVLQKDTGDDTPWTDEDLEICTDYFCGRNDVSREEILELIEMGVIEKDILDEETKEELSLVGAYYNKMKEKISLGIDKAQYVKAAVTKYVIEKYKIVGLVLDVGTVPATLIGENEKEDYYKEPEELVKKCIATIVHFRFSGSGALDININAGSGIRVVIKKLTKNRYGDVSAKCVHDEYEEWGKFPPKRSILLARTGDCDGFNTYDATVYVGDGCNTDIEFHVKEHIEYEISMMGGVWTMDESSPITVYKKNKPRRVFARWYVNKGDVEELVIFLYQILQDRKNETSGWDVVRNMFSPGNLVGIVFTVWIGVMLPAEVAMGIAIGIGLTLFCSLLPGYDNNELKKFEKMIDSVITCGCPQTGRSNFQCGVVIEFACYGDSSMEYIVQHWDSDKLGGLMHGPQGFIGKKKGTTTEWAITEPRTETCEERFSKIPSADEVKEALK